jgi:dephospho-CoA kinase
MLKIGLTGNIGSGKTIVSEIFRILNVPIYCADESAKSFLNSDEVKFNLIKKFGEEIVGIDKFINKEKFAEIIFNNKQNLEFVNSIIHPLVLKDFEEWSDKFKDQPYVIMESAIVFESHLDKLFNKIIVVYCPKEIRIKRVANRDKVNNEKVISRMNNQIGDEEKNALADFIITNDNLKMVIPQVLEIDKKLRDLN